ncbi:TPA: hypothetical protein OT243_005388, partial [Klebsiella pneumoniae]|nr:hypothetical protein [Klebsiella pneumoniae]
LDLYYKAPLGESVATDLSTSISVSADNNAVDEAHSDVKGVDGVVTEIGSPTGTITLSLKDVDGNILGKVPAGSIKLTPNGVAGAVIIDDKPVIDAAKGIYKYKVSAKKAGDYIINLQVGNTVFEDKKATLKVLSDKPVAPSKLTAEKATALTNEKIKVSLTDVVRGKDDVISDDISQLISLKDGDTSFAFT